MHVNPETPTQQAGMQIEVMGDMHDRQDGTDEWELTMHDEGKGG